MELRYTNSAGDDGATMFLYGTIGREIDGRYFAEEMRWHHDAMGRQVTVYINSPGGNVFDGYAIIQAIIDSGANTHVVGLAASMAGMAMLFGKRRTANDFAVSMFHPPQGNGSPEELLDIIIEKFTMILKKCTGKEEDEVKKLFMKGDNFYDASEMLTHNLIDEIVPTSIERKALTGLDTSQVYNIFNTLIEEFDMKNVKAHLKLDEKAGEQEVLDNIKAFETSISDRDQTIADKELEIQNLQEQLATSNKKIAEMVIDSAILDGKIDKDKKDVWVGQAVKDLDGVKNQLESIKVQTVQASVQNTIIDSDKGKKFDVEGIEDVIDFVQNNQKELAELRDSDPEKFEKVMKIYNEKIVN